MESNTPSIQNPFENPGEFADEAARFDPSVATALEDWGQSSATQGQVSEWLGQGERLLEEKQAGVEAHFAYAMLLGFSQKREQAGHELVVLCERLSQVEGWTAMVIVAQHALDLDAGPPAARWYVRAADKVGTKEEQFAALAQAHIAAPAEVKIAWRLARELEDRGDEGAAIETTARTLDSIAKKKEIQGLDDVLLHILETPRAATLKLIFHPLRVFAKEGEVDRVADFLEMAWPSIAENKLAPEAWSMLRQTVPEVDSPERLSKLLPRAVELAFPEKEEARRVLEMSGHGTDKPYSEIFDLFDRLLPFSVGSYAEHRSWGAGRVTRLDIEEVWLDFPNRAGHRMTVRAANQALTPLNPDDLAVIASRDPDKLEKLREKDPVDLVARALRRLKGSATTAELKRFLVHYAVPEKGWTRFWNSAKSRFADDPRIDDSQGYQGIYKTGSEETPVDSESPDQKLPRFDRGQNPRQVIATIRKFLEQHPELGARLVEKRGSVLRAWRDDPQLPWRDRIGAQWVLIHGGDPEEKERAIQFSARAFQDGFALKELTTADEQMEVLSWGIESEYWRDAIHSAMASRFSAVKKAVLEHSTRRLGGDEASYFDEIARSASKLPEAALNLAQLHYGAKSDPPEELKAPSPWSVAIGLAELMEGGSTGPQSRAALSVFGTNGKLAKAARATPVDEDSARTLRRLVSHWRGTDMNLHPFLEWLEAVGQGESAREARERKKEAARAVTLNTGPVAVHERIRPYMTKATYDRLRKEAEELSQALKTTIPQAIQTARELGDLRENAEFESAKLKQRQAQARLKLLADRIEDALFIDDLEPDTEVISLGCEVDLEIAGGSKKTIWLLGDGDDVHGPTVVSYKAPLGVVLIDRRLGDKLEIPSEDKPVEATVLAIRHRLPKNQK